jgi:hypothetical protein
MPDFDGAHYSSDYLRAFPYIGAPFQVLFFSAPLDPALVLHTDSLIVRARYEYADFGEPTLGSLVDAFLHD